MNISQTTHTTNFNSPLRPEAVPGVPEDKVTARKQSLPPIEEAKQGEAATDRENQAKPGKTEQTEKKAELAQELQDREVITELKARDREVRAHEAAHAAVGGQYAGAPTYTFQRGPNGVSYAVGGEVSISTSAISGNPEATLEKAQQIQRAATAPAEPSNQDRRVAAQAAQMAQQARADIALELEAEQTTLQSKAETNTEGTNAEGTDTEGIDTENSIETQSDGTGLAIPVVNIPQLLVDAGVRENDRGGRIINQLA
tara:strand:+ start:1059 stop:1829 length:771 start_codon:yes stop_codon:yes gene_type:complete